MADRNIRGVIERGETIWVEITRADAATLDTLAQAIFDRLAPQVAGVDDAHIDARLRLGLLGDQDIDFQPGGDEYACENFLNDIKASGQDHWFDADPTLSLGLDFGLQEMRIA